MLLQLNPTIPLDTPKGKADAHFVIDYGTEHDLQYVCFVRQSGECWTFKSPKIRLEKNVTGDVRAGEGIVLSVRPPTYFKEMADAIVDLARGGEPDEDFCHSPAYDSVQILRQQYEEEVLAVRDLKFALKEATDKLATYEFPARTDLFIAPQYLPNNDPTPPEAELPPTEKVEVPF